MRFLSTQRRATEERLLWSRDIRFVHRLAMLIDGGRLIELDTGTVLIGQNRVLDSADLVVLLLAVEEFAKEKGTEAARRMPPVNTALRIGVKVGAGTDAHRVASYNPFVALQWLLDGKTVGGDALRGAEEAPTREQALRLYTSGSAWSAGSPCWSCDSCGRPRA